MTGLGRQRSYRIYAFTTVTPIPLQIDGELMDLPAASIPVDFAPGALRTVL